MSDSRVDVEQPSSWEVRWKGLTFKVPDKANGQKTILDDCAGAVRGGQVCGVLGPSGSGKTTVMAALEDLGFYCADNMPVQLIGQFVDLCAKSTPPVDKIALALDAREGQFLAELPATLKELRARGYEVELLFLEADVPTLVNRYRETRRVHPLSPSGSVADGIARERELLATVAGLETQIQAANAELRGYRAQLTRVRGAVRELLQDLTALDGLVSSEPQPAPAAPPEEAAAAGP